MTKHQAHTGQQRRQPMTPTGRYGLTERDIQTLALETNADNAFTFSASDCTPVVDLARSVRRSLLLARADGANDLAELIGPQELSLLLDAFFDKRPVVLRAKEHRGRFSHFYTRAHMKAALNGRRIEPDHMKLVTAKGDFCTQAFLNSRTRTRKTLGDRIVEFVEKSGGTFNVSRIYNHSAEVAGLVRTLNRLFKARISASAFFTGPRGQAFPVHWDTFDTFIFQVEGQKNWTVYKPMIRVPLPDIHFALRSRDVGTGPFSGVRSCDPYLETKFASVLSYGLSTELLNEILPIDDKLNPVTLRNHLFRVAQRTEDALGEEQESFIDGCPRDWGRLPVSDGPLTVGIDGGFVRAPRKDGWFEVIVGKSMLAFTRDEEQAIPSSKCFGLVRTFDTKPKRRLFELLKVQGMQMNQQFVFLSDGGESVRDLQEYLNPEAEHCLDWFHIPMRLTVLG